MFVSNTEQQRYLRENFLIRLETICDHVETEQRIFDKYRHFSSIKWLKVHTAIIGNVAHLLR